MRGARASDGGADDAPAQRLTILIHVAPLSVRRTRLRPLDTMMLRSVLASLLERVPATSVRLVLFSLAQQAEIYRKDDFRLSEMTQVAQAMNALDLGKVDFEILKHKRGHVELLTELVNREMAESPESDAVVFLGPENRFDDRVPAAGLERSTAHHPQFWYLEVVPVTRAQPILDDSIRSAVSRLGGKTATIHTPGEFARAIERIERGDAGHTP